MCSVYLELGDESAIGSLEVGHEHPVKGRQVICGIPSGVAHDARGADEDVLGSPNNSLVAGVNEFGLVGVHGKPAFRRLDVIVVAYRSSEIGAGVSPVSPRSSNDDIHI